MPPPSTVSDPTDWLLTPLSLLSPLEAALRCQVCKEFFDTPMLTSCSHTFCSLCIRRCLNSDGKCPACRASDQADRLRRNWVVQEVVDAFRAARPAALEVARAGVVLEGNGERQGWGRNKKRKMEDVDADVNMDMEEGGATRRSRRTRRRSRSLELGTSQAEAIEVDDSGDGDYDPDDGTALCPMCKARMKVAAVFAHLDMCTGTKPAGNGAGKGRIQKLPQPKEPPPSAARLPQLNYSLLKDNALRKKLQDLGIAAHGPRSLVIRRHTEWVNLWNSNCDSTRPRTKRELLRELDTWERSQGGGASTAPSAIMRKDFDGKAWMANNKDQFAELIVKARQNAKMRKEAKEEEKASEGQMSNHSARPVLEPAPLTQPSVQEAEPAKPYEGNDQALSIVEEKVEQPNSNGRQLRSWSQALPTRPARGEEIPDSTEDDTSGDCEMDVDPPLYSQYNPSQPPPPSQAQTASSSLGDRKADMFKLPEDPIVDTDGGTAV